MGIILIKMWWIGAAPIVSQPSQVLLFGTSSSALAGIIYNCEKANNEQRFFGFMLIISNHLDVGEQTAKGVFEFIKVELLWTYGPVIWNGSKLFHAISFAYHPLIWEVTLLLHQSHCMCKAYMIKRFPWVLIGSGRGMEILRNSSKVGIKLTFFLHSI